MNAAVIHENVTCAALVEVEQGAVLVDAEGYYAAFCTAALLARRYIYISGWQFDTHARLLRPDARQPVAYPVEFVPFLNYLCELTPELEVYITAWDYSLVYALEREWLQKLKFYFQSHARVHFEFLDHPEPGGCHHHKLVIIDGELAFVGGLDVCDARWDTRRHAKNDLERIDVHGKPYKPFHDLQVVLRGPVIAPLQQLFLDGWREARGEPLAAPSCGPGLNGADDDTQQLGRLDLQRFDLERLGLRDALRVRARRIAVARTEWAGSGYEPVCEIQALFERAILAAEQLIYIETQYFTSRAMAMALYQRLSDSTRSKLQVVFVMPDGADSPKEDFVLGNRQRVIRRFIADVARHHGHEFRLLMSSMSTPEQPCLATFIHSKLLIVDDEFLSIGSANMTNRSMRVDREVNVAWQASLEAPADAAGLIEDIRALRGSLLAEHAGVMDSAFFSPVCGLIERLDRVCQDPDAKLRWQPLPKPRADNPLLIALFDPSGPLDWALIDDSLEEVFHADEGIVKKGAQKLGQRLGVVDIE
jgi:phospholipase D1/2